MPEPNEPQPETLEGELLAGDARVAVVVSRFNEFITEHLKRAAINTWQRIGGKADQLTVAYVPGSFELPVTAKKLAETGDYHAVVCLGCVIRGETDHYDHVVEQTAKGIREVSTQTGVPCIFGVITCETLEQAIDRAGAKAGNQGGKAMLAAVEMANLLKKVGTQRPSDPGTKGA
ncbi:MAG: 6,7-dimethyl-8-ribityllumazine synthase [Phycisphaeraceae bacterium]